MSKLEKEFGKYPNSIKFVRLASLYLDKGRPQDAVALCEKGCEKQKDYALGYYLLARSYFAVGDFERAIEASSHACLLEPENPSGLRLHAEICSNLGQFAIAIANLRRAFQIDPFGKSVSERIDELKSMVAFEVPNTELVDRPDVHSEEAQNYDNSPVVSSDSHKMLDLDAEVTVEKCGKHKTEMEKESHASDGIDSKESRSDAVGVESESSLEDSEDRNQSDTKHVTTPEELVAQSVSFASKPSLVEKSLSMPRNDDTDELTNTSEFSDNSLSMVNNSVGCPVLSEEPGQDLFRLFQEIETEGGAVVDVALFPDVEEFEMSDDGQNISTLTLADIYVVQGLTNKAIEIYQELLEDDPGNVELSKKLSALRANT
ncbi:MAG: CDC27 family protein [Candidatus Latescibacterota bacterium]|nr:CDC27 family protein [Candidatus Latescibacterota bacterium]